MFKWLASARDTLYPDECTNALDMARLYWMRRATEATRREVAKGKLKDLTLKEYQGVLVIRGRAAEAMEALYGTDCLPVIMASERVAELVVIWAHNKEHKGIDITVYHTRKVLDCTENW